MQPWRLGDPVGMGEVYLPDKKAREAYGKACVEAVIESAAKHVASLPSITSRRAYIDSFPADRREALKQKITEVWNENNSR
jgi:hypothetical protein